ncbi:cytochrome P450, partial [Pseudomonas otitidis]
RSEEAILAAHHRYGDVVRIGPKTVIAGSPDAVTKVLGYNQNYLVKHADYDALVVHRPSIFSETQKSKHAVKRRIAAHAYSMNTVTNLEAFVQAHIVLFLQTMDKFARNGEIVEITQWFKFYAFDVIG